MSATTQPDGSAKSPLRLLNAIAATTGQPVAEQIQQALQLTCDLLDLDIGILSRIEGEAYRVEVCHAPPGTVEPGQTFPLGQTYCSITLQAADVIAIDHMAESPYRGHPCYQAFGLEAYIGHPVTVHGQPRGTLSFSAAPSRSRPFTEDDRDYVRLLATWVCAALERDEDERALAESEARLQLLVKHAPVELFALDPQGVFTLVEGRSLAASRVGAEHLIGQDIAGVYADHPEVLDGVARALGGQDARWSHAHDGQHTETHLAPVLGPDGRVQGAIGVVTDVTEQQRTQQLLSAALEQAETAARLKAAILANMSHEIRTPLTSILGFAALLEDEVSEENRHFAEVIVRAGQRLRDTIDSVLDMARFESEGIEPHFMPTRLAEDVTDVLESLEPLAAQRGLGFEVEVEPIGTVVTDSLLVGRILNNLVSNAVKFTEQGHVRARLRAVATAGPDPDVLLVEVSDTGVGIDAEFLPSLFEPFSQESEGYSRLYEGTGLGLSIVKRLVDLLGGTVAVESTKGRGSTFTVRLPLHRPEDAFRPVPEEPEPDFACRPAVLLVEDAPEMRLLAQRLLESVADVRVAADPLEAQAVAAEQPFDVLLLDINLGTEMDGADLLAALRERPGYADVPAAAMTAYALPGDRERFLAVGFQDYVAKPFTETELLATVQRLLTGAYAA